VTSLESTIETISEMSKDVLSSYDVEDLVDLSKRSDRNALLLELVHKRNIDGLDSFRRALQVTGQTDLLTLLDAEIVKVFEES